MRDWVDLVYGAGLLQEFKGMELAVITGSTVGKRREHWFNSVVKLIAGP